MKLLKYKHGNLIFDNWTLNHGKHLNYGWTQICEKHFNELTYDGSIDQDSGHGICGVKSCNTESEHYLDFDKEDVE